MTFARLVLGVTLIGAVMGSPGTAAGQTPREDSVTGSTVSAFFINVRLDAHSGPSGEHPRGTVQFNGVATSRSAGR